MTFAGQDIELREASRAVANAKLREYRRQCWRLAALTARGIVVRADAIDKLWEIAVAHALVRALGEERISAILAEAFSIAPPEPEPPAADCDRAA
jgi:hypothetical protein